MVRVAAGHAEDGDEERQGHQCWPHPFRLLLGVDLTEEVAFHFHNWVFLCWFCFSVSTNDMVRKLISCCGRLVGACGCYPQQPPDFFSGFVPAGAERNFCRQWSLQK